MSIGNSDVNSPNPLNELFESDLENDINHLHQNLYDLFPGIIYIYDTGKKSFRYVNKKITEILGYSVDDLKAWDNDFSKVIFTDDQELVNKELEKYNDLKESDSYGYRCRLNKKSGEFRHFHIMGKVLKYENGKPTSILFTAQDVSDQMHSLEETKALKELMNETEELLLFGTWTWEAKTGNTKWSKGIFNILGYDEDTRPDLTDRDFFIKHVLPEQRDEVDLLIRNAVHDKKDFEKEFLLKDSHNEEKIVYSKGKVILDENNNVVKVIGIMRCITEQSRLYNSLADYKQMVLEKEEFLGHGSWEMNYADQSISWSDGMYRLFDYDPDKDKDKLVIDEKFYLSHMSDNDYKLNKDLREDAIKDKKSYLWEYEITTHTGNVKKLETFCKIIRDRNDNPTQLIGATRDVTQLRKYEWELERNISELNRSNKDLEDFAYIASHDIQEPLRKITSFSERLKNKFSDQLDDEAKKYLERIMVATKNARLLIDGLMDFSRLTGEGQSFQQVDLNVLVQEVKTELELKIEETEATIIVEQLPVIEAVPLQLKQLLSNLILNAIKFRNPHLAPYITIKATKLSRKEEDAFKLKGSLSYYKITIEDNGIGFEEEYAERIFQMFQRLHGKAEYPGAGIGLALCKKITENHNGIIFANSQLGIGTIFSLILPQRQL